MDSNRSSRKRKQPPNPLKGIFTRSKSRTYAHPSRSGRLRPDSSRILKSDLPLTMCPRHSRRQPRAKPNEQVDTSNLHVPEVRVLNTKEPVKEAEIKTTDTSIKDLRARRVFSKPSNNLSVELLDATIKPNLVPVKFNYPQESVVGEQPDCPKVVGGDLVSSGLDGSKKIELGFNCGKEGGSDKSSNGSHSENKSDVMSEVIVAERKSEYLSFQNPAGFSCTDDRSNYLTPNSFKQGRGAALSSEQQRNSSDMLDVEDVQTTPPDTNVIDKLNDALTGAGKKMALNISPVVSQSLNQIKKNDSSSSSKFVLNPCHRLKVFKTASSFNYMRLLPYVTDIAKVKSGNSSLSSTRTQESPPADVNMEELRVNPVSKTEDRNENQPNEQSEASLSHESNMHNQGPEKKSVGSVPLSGCSKTAEEFCKEAITGALKENHAIEETTNTFCQEDTEATIPVTEQHSPIVCNSGPVGGPCQMHQSLAENNGNLSSVSAEDVLGHAASSLERGCRSKLSNPIFSRSNERVSLTSEQQENSAEPAKMIVEDIQTTPPDTNILDKLKDNPSRVNTEKVMLPLDGNDMICQGSSLNKRNGSNMRSKLGLNFKTANSFSYRRLLPYLKDIGMDQSSVNTCSMIENSKEEKPSVQSQTSCPQLTLVDSSSSEKSLPCGDLSRREEEVCEESTTGASKVNRVLETISSSLFDDMEANPPNSDGESRMQLAHNSPKVPPPEEHSPEKQSESHNSTVCNSSPAEESVQMKQLAIYHAGSSSDEHRRSDSNLESNKGKGKKRRKCDDMVTVCQSSSPVKGVCSDLGVQTKGILKKNPRGCRGLCSCLHCSSFRLNAERAFEFSRNQMLDTEELVLHLVNDLSRVRNVLKKTVDDSDSDAIFQVEEICEKAEDLAKTRLREMKEDLSVHCRTKRLDRPSVNFALSTGTDYWAKQITK